MNEALWKIFLLQIFGNIYISAIIFYNKDCSQKINLFSKDLVHFRIKF